MSIFSTERLHGNLPPCNNVGLGTPLINIFDGDCTRVHHVRRQKYSYRYHVHTPYPLLPYNFATLGHMGMKTTASRLGGEDVHNYLERLW